MSPDRRAGSTPRRTTPSQSSQRSAGRSQSSSAYSRGRDVSSRSQQPARSQSARTQSARAQSARTQSTRTHSSRTQSSRSQSASSEVRARHGAQQRPTQKDAQSIGFANSRRGQRAARGEVRNVGTAATMPKASGKKRGSSQPIFSSNKGFAHEIQRAARIKRIVAILIAALVVIGVGVGVGMLVFYGGLSSKFALAGGDRPTSLVAQTQDKPYYVLVSADLDTSDGCDTDIDALALVHVDPASKRLALVSVPTKISVKMSDGSTRAIRDAVYVGGNTELVSAVQTLTGENISHLVKTDEPGIRALVEGMGGLTLHLSEEVDDPNAGYIYIPDGQQKLDADQTMTFLRASNYRGGEKTMRENQTLVIAMAVEYFSQGTAAETSSRLDGVAGCFQTDWSGKDLASALSGMNGFQASDSYRDSIPCYATSIKDDALYAAYEDSMNKLFANIDTGNYTSGTQGSLDNIVPGAYTVTVRNGSGITGGATSIANMLSGAGFNVTETGNAESFVYNETLVVYGNDTLKEAAQAAVGVLGVGHATEAGVYYTYNTDLLVILGSDWKPTS